MVAVTSVVLCDPRETPHQRSVRSPASWRTTPAQPWEGYTHNLRQFYRWCAASVCSTAPTKIELYARKLEGLGAKPAAIGRRLSTASRGEGPAMKGRHM